jgi:hypothetical protein
MMNATSVLIDRFRAIANRLDYLRSAVAPPSAVQPHWTERELVSAIAERRQNDRDIERTTADERSWAALTARETACLPLFREALAYLQVKGSAFKEIDAVDNAQALVAELAQVCRVDEPLIVPDVTDQFADYVQIIRVRFPPADIWDVPVVAHEFGHFAAYRFTRRADGGDRTQPMKEFVTQRLACETLTDDEESKWRRWYNEMYADAFGVFTLGPSFAASALLTRFKVAEAAKNSNDHPSYAARASLILRLLQRMGPEYSSIHRELARLWNDMLTSARVQVREDWAIDCAGGLENVLQVSAPEGRYKTWRVPDEDLRFAVENKERQPKRPFSMRDLLNAAWYARLAGGEPAAISKRARELWLSRGKP